MVLPFEEYIPAEGDPAELSDQVISLFQREVKLMISECPDVIAQIVHRLDHRVFLGIDEIFHVVCLYRVAAVCKDHMLMLPSVLCNTARDIG